MRIVIRGQRPGAGVPGDLRWSGAPGGRRRPVGPGHARDAAGPAAAPGAGAQVLAIGPAGENKVRFATVQHAEENAAGHSGFGAVWGSKNLKAVAVRGTAACAWPTPEHLLTEVLARGQVQHRAQRAHAGSGGSAGAQARPVCTPGLHLQLPGGRLRPGRPTGARWWGTVSAARPGSGRWS